MKKIIIGFVLLLLILSGNVYCQNYQKVLIHAHDSNSDGLLPENNVVEYAKKQGTIHVFLTPHLPCILGVCSGGHVHKMINNSRAYYTQTFKDETRSVEIFTNIDKAHILLIGQIRNLYDHDEFIKMGKELLPSKEICTYARNNNLLSIMAHPHDAYDPDAINDFDCIEFFNTRMYRLQTLDPFGLLEMDWIALQTAQEKDLEVYCNAIKKYIENPNDRKIPAVVAGSDAHFVTKELYYGYTFANIEGFINENSIIQSIKNGKTYAVMYGHPQKAVKIISLNYHPQKNPFSITTDSVTIAGKIAVPLDFAKKEKLQLYCNGNLLSTIDIANQNTSFNFIDKNIQEDGVRVYFLYIPGRMVTSPIVFNIQIDETAEYESVLESSVHHLGDDRYKTPVNTGFVKNAEAVSWSRQFDLPKRLLDRSDGFIVVNLRGAEFSSLFINDKVCWRLKNTIENNGKAQAFKIPRGLLKESDNIIRIISHVNPNDHTDNDDVEFGELTIFFGNIQSHVVPKKMKE